MTNDILVIGGDMEFFNTVKEYFNDKTINLLFITLVSCADY